MQGVATVFFKKENMHLCFRSQMKRERKKENWNRRNDNRWNLCKDLRRKTTTTKIENSNKKMKIIKIKQQHYIQITQSI